MHNRVAKSLLGSSVRSLRLSSSLGKYRYIHYSNVSYHNNNDAKNNSKNNDAAKTPPSDIDDTDTLSHIYKKKYEFIQKQNLENSYNMLNSISTNGSNENSNQNNYKNYNNEDIEDKTMQLTQKYKLLIGGLVALITTIGGLQIYQNWSFIKSNYIGDNELESFDEMYERIKDKKQKKQLNLENFTKKITNPNDSSVPGVYICGNNQSNLVTDEKFEFIPVLKRLDIFDNFIVRDIVMSENSGALIDENGDLYQWGFGFSKNIENSKKSTLKGKNLKKVQISNKTIYTLTENGEVLYLPESLEMQNQIDNIEKGWLGNYKVNYFKLSMPINERTSKIIDIAAGIEHLVLLNKKGSVLTCATGFNTKIEKSFGQFGLPEFSQFDKPPIINQVHDVILLNKYMKNGNVLNREIKQIAAGDNFTLCLDQTGCIWAFGKNTHGAIGSVINYDTEIIPYPTQVKLSSTHFKRNEFPRCIDISAGGDTAFATFTSDNMYELFEKSFREKNNNNSSFDFESLPAAEENKIYLSWGHGLKGELGLGYFIHGTNEPKKIKILNEIKEFNELNNKLEKIGIKSWSIGKNHVVVTLNNDDVYVWGDNEYGQLANGKRIRSAIPSNIPSLLEPNSDNKMKLAKYNNRLQLKHFGKVHQEIVAGEFNTAIIYKKD